MMTSVAEDSGFRDIKRKPKPGWERWRPPPERDPRWGLRGKTVWDWLQLLIVPLMLALITVGFAWQQDMRQNDIEDRRAEAEQKLAEQRAQDEALQAYLDQMSQLILDRNLLAVEQGNPVHDQGDPVHTLAQARTSTAILRLDAEHNESVTRFLINSGLAKRSETSPRLLREITLSHATLSGTDLAYADLSRADLRDANLSDADLFFANLRLASLMEADLSGASLIEADLSNANLNGSNLSDADLKGANLYAAYGITGEELEQRAFSLADATMPNGQKYEDWRKDRESSGEEGKNE